MAPTSRPRSDDHELRSDARRNREQLARAAVVALHRDGLTVPMATIAGDAKVGIGTLYRHFPNREDLLDELTYRSFERLVNHLEHASEGASTATETLRRFLSAVIGDRNDLLLPGTGGPDVQTERTRARQQELHGLIKRVIDRGAEDGTILRKVDVWDVAALGATLAQPSSRGGSWDAICRRLLDTYIAGLGVPQRRDAATR